MFNSAYSILILSSIVAWLAGIPVAMRSMRLNVYKGAICAFVAVPVAFLGARALNILINPRLIFSFDSLFKLDFVSFTLYGGMLAGLLAMILSAWAVKLPIRRFLDAAAPVAGICIGIARIGCIMTGCCFGLPTDVPWGIIPPYGGAAHQFQLDSGYIGNVFGMVEFPMPIHPTQVYELAAALIACMAAILFLVKKAPEGIPFSLFGLTFSVLRFLIFFFRAYPGMNVTSRFIRGPLAFTASILVFGIYLLFSLIRYKKNKGLVILPEK